MTGIPAIPGMTAMMTGIPTGNSKTAEYIEINTAETDDVLSIILLDGVFSQPFIYRLSAGGKLLLCFYILRNKNQYTFHP